MQPPSFLSRLHKCIFLLSWLGSIIFGQKTKDDKYVQNLNLWVCNYSSQTFYPSLSLQDPLILPTGCYSICLEYVSLPFIEYQSINRSIDLSVFIGHLSQPCHCERCRVERCTELWRTWLSLENEWPSSVLPYLIPTTTRVTVLTLPGTP